MSKKTSMYCFCDATHTRFTGGCLTTPSSDVIEISLKFEKLDNFPNTNNDNINNNRKDQERKLNFIELSEKTLKDVCKNDSVHVCIKDLLQNIIVKKKSSTNIPQIIKTPLTPVTPLSNITTITNVTVHQQPTAIMDDNIYVNYNHDEELSLGGELLVKRNSSKRSSMKSSKSMENILERSLKERLKEKKSPDDSKAKSVGNVNNEDDEEDDKDYDEYENGESIELIFISDEFVNKVNKVKEEVVIVDGKDDKRRESLTSCKKKLVIITDDFKEKVLRNNSIVITNEKKMLKKLNKKSSKTYNTNSNSFLPYDEPDSNDEKTMEDKNLDGIFKNN